MRATGAAFLQTGLGQRFPSVLGLQGQMDAQEKELQFGTGVWAAVTYPVLSAGPWLFGTWKVEVERDTLKSLQEMGAWGCLVIREE